MSALGGRVAVATGADQPLGHGLAGAVEARTALRRTGDPELDVGAVAAFLASDDGGFITGPTIVGDGGSFMGR